ncbi:MAG TPA: tRNA (guanosine(37)-N1)-methyltransferase TrmD, partial [Bacillota bacterium]|nr:tRNA (guanosine(37)-N1)-methyltransferase TrmD [Bacillota bacterium]
MTLFPEVVRAVLDSSITGRAQAAGYIKINTYNIRDYSKDKHRRVDDTPYGGGRGMLMAPQPIYDCYQAILKECAPDEKRRVIYLSPKGKVFTQETAKRFAGYDRLILLCGHYEGIDQRVLDLIVDEYVSI